MELELSQITESCNNPVVENGNSKEYLVKTIGRDFNKSISNLNGLVSLLNDSSTSEADIEQIHLYLSIEVKKLRLLVLNICG